MLVTDEVSCKTIIELVVHISYPTRSNGLMQTPKCKLIITFILSHLYILSDQAWCGPNDKA